MSIPITALMSTSRELMTFTIDILEASTVETRLSNLAEFIDELETILGEMSALDLRCRAEFGGVERMDMRTYIDRGKAKMELVAVLIDSDSAAGTWKSEFNIQQWNTWDDHMFNVRGIEIKINRKITAFDKKLAWWWNKRKSG